MLIRDLASNALEALACGLEALSDSVISLKTIRSEVARHVPSDIATIIVKQLVALGTFRRKYGKTAGETLQALRLGLASFGGWSEEDIAKWDKIDQPLERLLSLEVLNAAIKAVDLSYDYDKLMNSARILTEIRPVFDEERVRIIGAVICQVVRIEYVMAEGFRAITVALDDADIKMLSDSCASAMKKSNAARGLISDSVSLPVFCAGEETYDVG